MRHIFRPVFFLSLFAMNYQAAFAQERDSALENESRMPVVSVAQGLLYFLGDVGYSHLNEPVTSKSGLQFELQQHTNSRFSVSLFILGGRVSGQEKTTASQLNFESGIVAEGLQLRYDFSSRRKPDQVLIPYLSAGIEYMIFHARGDLKDANGNYYHYWDDGTIRNMDQHDSSASGAQIIHRDYDYETDLRDANLDGFGRYRQSTVGFPVGAGVRFRISSRVAMHFGANVHITRTDLIDNVSSEGANTRKGNSMKDKIIFTFVSFRYDIAGKRDVPKRRNRIQGDFKNVNFDALGSEDADHDGVADVEDAVIDTNRQTKVDATGKPVDTDNDGIPDYRDKEPASQNDALVNEEGVTITEEMIEAKWREDSLAALPAIVEYLHHTDKFGQADAGARKTIPPLFKSLDTDGNRQISPAEIGAAIDLYLEGKSSFTVPEFYELIDFFFSQN